MTLQITVSQLPTRGSRFHDESTVLTGNAIGFAQTAGAFFNGYWRQNIPAVNDSFTVSFFLRAGTYTFYVLGNKGSDAGKIDWYLNNSIVITGQDWYNSTNQDNQIQSSSVTIPTDGYQIMKGIVSSKNASSSSYFMRLQQMWFKQASD